MSNPEDEGSAETISPVECEEKGEEEEEETKVEEEEE